MSTISTIEKKAVKGGKYVNRQEVDTFIRAYKQETWVHNTERIGKEDAKSSWYTVDELEGFLAKVKQQGGNGVRMHFGIYPEGYGNNPELAGRQAIVLVGTRSSDGTVTTSKELYIGNGKETKILAFVGDYPCPAYCPFPYTPPTTGSAQTAVGTTLVDMGEKGMQIV
ncbi:MAG TPA: hypothetical protein VL832_06745 [Puia sp.]|jgi:hypothetical protein|nr:hypothetical protein [Puia sp.]